MRALTLHRMFTGPVIWPGFRRRCRPESQIESVADDDLSKKLKTSKNATEARTAFVRNGTRQIKPKYTLAPKN